MYESKFINYYIKMKIMQRTHWKSESNQIRNIKHQYKNCHLCLYRLRVAKGQHSDRMTMVINNYSRLNTDQATMRQHGNFITSGESVSLCPGHWPIRACLALCPRNLPPRNSHFGNYPHSTTDKGCGAKLQGNTSYCLTQLCCLSHIIRL